MKKNIILSLLLLAVVLPSFAQEWNASSNPPFGWSWLKAQYIKFYHRGKTSMTGFDMVYTTSREYSGDDYDPEDPKVVRYVYIIEDNKNKAPHNMGAMPPKAAELIYHKLDDGTEFCGVLVNGDLVNKNGERTSSFRFELKIDDDTANLLMELLLNESGWDNKTGIKFSMTTSPRLRTPEFY